MAGSASSTGSKKRMERNMEKHPDKPQFDD